MAGRAHLIDLLQAECPELAAGKKRRRRRNKHVNPTSQRNLVRPPPPPPRCRFRDADPGADPASWVVLVRCSDPEKGTELDEKLPEIAHKAGLTEAALSRHGDTRLVYAFEEGAAKALHRLLEGYKAVYLGQTREAAVPKRVIEIHGLPEDLRQEDIVAALQCQFVLCDDFRVSVVVNKRRTPGTEFLVETGDAAVCRELLSQIGFRLYDSRLTFRCTQRREPLPSEHFWKKRKAAKEKPEEQRQCFRCLGFGHVALCCLSEPRCRHCGARHVSADCTERKQGKRCFNCGSQQHATTSRACPKRPGNETRLARLAAAAAAAAPSLPPAPPTLPAEGVSGGPAEPQPAQENPQCEGEAENHEEEEATVEARSSPDMASTTPEPGPETEDTVPSSQGAPGVSSTTEDKKSTSEPAGDEAASSEDTAEAKDDSDKTETEEKRAEEKNGDEEDELGATGPEDVRVFTGSDDGEGEDAETEAVADDKQQKTAEAVASFFSELFGAAESPSKPLDGGFAATLRSLQESVFADLSARRPRRGASCSPRERKPLAKKRRLLAEALARREMHTQTPSPGGSPRLAASAARKKSSSGRSSRQLAERRLRVLEHLLLVVGAILEM